MSKTTFCSVPALWTLEEYGLHRCDDYSHKHLSRGQVLRYEREGRVRWLRRADAGRSGVLHLTAAPAAYVHCAAPVNRITVRDASCRVGELLVVAAGRGEPWAVVMLLHTRSRALRSDRYATVGE